MSRLHAIRARPKWRAPVAETWCGHDAAASPQRITNAGIQRYAVRGLPEGRFLRAQAPDKCRTCVLHVRRRAP